MTQPIVIGMVVEHVIYGEGVVIDIRFIKDLNNDIYFIKLSNPVDGKLYVSVSRNSFKPMEIRQ